MFTTKTLSSTKAPTSWARGTGFGTPKNLMKLPPAMDFFSTAE